MDENTAKEIERKFYRNKKSVTPDDIFLLAKYYADLHESNKDKPQEKKRKKPSPLMHGIYLLTQAYKRGARSRDQLLYYKKLLSKHSYHLSHNMLLVKIIAELNSLDGLDIKVINKVTGDEFVEGGTLFLGDEKYVGELTEEITKESDYTTFNKITNDYFHQGKCATFGTGGDGNIGLQIRLVDGSAPTLSEKEYLYCSGSSQEFLLSVTSGVVKFCEFSDGIKMKVPPGIYTCIIFMFEVPDKFFGYYAVLVKSESKKVENIGDIGSLEPGL
ncbi:hypothetical protein IPM62_01045 [Candidatus Woesebacteria bacterium]|nr:MAG: hypothetical protein IPM62_01045 [Candidatus Woesebacteria bacterium]